MNDISLTHTLSIVDLIKSLLIQLGEDPNREGLKKTPERVKSSFESLTSGYYQSAEDIFKEAVFEEDYDEMVVLKDIEVFSLCEHHLLPFFGKCHVAYIPKKKIVGLSKLAKVVEMYSKRLQVQERLTNEIAQAIEKHLNPLGVGVVIEAAHLCMIMRGSQKYGSKVITSSMLGIFRQKQATRMEFMNLIKA